VESYIGEIIIIGDFFTITVYHSPILFHIYTSNIFEGWAIFFTFLCGPPKDFYQVRKLHWSWSNGTLGIKCLFDKPSGNKLQ
jgi:hypothetical protein